MNSSQNKITITYPPALMSGPGGGGGGGGAPAAGGGGGGGAVEAVDAVLVESATLGMAVVSSG